MKSPEFQMRVRVAVAMIVAGCALTQPAGAGEEEELDEVTVLGSRRAIDPTETLAPVDLIGPEAFESVGAPDMDNIMRSLVPSYSVNQEAISDEASIIRPANLRGLPPDNTLVLVNGKRRHRGGIIGFGASGLSSGAQGPDIGPIPTIALKQVQVLRDGAAAQYGSDAIAGVIDYELKDSASGSSLEAKFGEFYEGDGTSYQVAANVGLPLGPTGFANLSAEYGESDPTSRSTQRADALGLIESGYAPYVDNVPVPAMIWGQPEVKKSLKFIANLGYTLGNAVELYGFGNYATREVDGGFFYRNPTNRGGIYSNDGGATLLVADAEVAAGRAAVCPTITFTDGIPDQTALAQISTGGALASQCFSFVELFPGGFTPRFGGTVDDYSVAAGVRGEFGSGLTYDASVYGGRSKVDYLIYNTVNPSLGPDTPTSMSPGLNQQTETNFNLDFAYPLTVGALASPLNVAFGFEARREEWKISMGDQASYLVGPYAAQGFGTGSNGYPGYGPQSAGTWTRDNVAVYTDLEADVTDALTLGAALRFEDFDDFGTTFNWKFSGRYDFTERFGLRGTVSTGFRAPTPGQSNTIKTTTSIVAGQLSEVGTLPPTNPITAALAGVLTDGAITATPLDPEKSVNWTVGVAYDSLVDVTVDFFHIKLKDRIALSSNLTVDRTNPEVQAILDELAAQGVPGVTQLSQFNFFTNDFATTTQGVDVVASLPFLVAGGDSSLSLAMNYTDTKLKERTLLVDEHRERDLEEMIPNYRATLTGLHSFGGWRLMARATYYDKFRWDDYNGWGIDETYSSQLMFDAEAAYTFSDKYTLAVGAQNIFDSYPDKYAVPDGLGYTYPTVAPAGFNGGYWYLRMNLKL
jgi:iron complex outermembrane recepter protein